MRGRIGLGQRMAKRTDPSNGGPSGPQPRETSAQRVWKLLRRGKFPCWLLLPCAVGCAEGGPDAAGQPQAPVHPGKAIYRQFCFTCHAAGLAGAPKPGDREAWAPRIAKGRAQLLRSTADGMPPGMPPRGLCMDCTEAQLEDAIDYMLLDGQ